MKDLVRRFCSTPTFFEEPFFDTMNETFKVLTSDWFSDRSKVSDAFKNQVQYPKTDVLETPEGYKFFIAVPGCEKGDVDVALEKGILSVKYDKASKKHVVEEGKLVRNELRHSSFQRAWTIDHEIKEEEIKASMENGILTIFVPFKIPEKVEIKAKKITVN